jgi:hypothetical protein
MVIKSRDLIGWQVIARKVNVATPGLPSLPLQLIEVKNPKLSTLILDVVFENTGESATLKIYGWNNILENWTLLESVSVNHNPSNIAGRYKITTDGCSIGVVIETLAGTVTVAATLGV